MAKSTRGGIRKKKTRRAAAPTSRPAPVELPDFPRAADDDELHTQVSSVGDLEVWLDSHRFRPVEEEEEDDDDATHVMGETLIGALVSGETRRSLDSGATVSGSLGEFAVVELLQLFAQRGKAGVLVVGDESGVGRVWVEEGAVLGAAWRRDPSVAPMKVLRRLVRITQGEFWFGPAKSEPPKPHIALPLANVLIQLLGDDHEEVTDEHPVEPDDDILPSEYSLLRVTDPLQPLLSDLSKEELNVLQLVLNHRTLAAVLAKTRGHDDAIKQTVRALLAREYLYVADDESY